MPLQAKQHGFYENENFQVCTDGATKSRHSIPFQADGLPFLAFMRQVLGGCADRTTSARTFARVDANEINMKQSRHKGFASRQARTHHKRESCTVHTQTFFSDSDLGLSMYQNTHIWCALGLAALLGLRDSICQHTHTRKMLFADTQSRKQSLSLYGRF